MPDFNCSRGGHYPLIVGFQQSQLSPSLAGIFVSHQTQLRTLHSGLGRQCVAIEEHQWRITKKIGRAILMDGYYVVEVTTTSYLGFGVIINIVSKEDITYRVTIGDIPRCTCPNFTKMSSHALKKKGKLISVLQTSLLC